LESESESVLDSKVIPFLDSMMGFIELHEFVDNREGAERLSINANLFCIVEMVIR